MKLSIVTINYNNAEGLRKTLRSVASQNIHPQSSLQKEGNDMCEIEHIIVDGGSTDGSVEVINNYVSEIEDCRFPIKVKWVSEKDKGIYNAMNKGILMAIGDYIQILNSGDCLASDEVCSSMFQALKSNQYPEILYGNMIKCTPDGRVVGKSGEVDYSLLNYFTSTMNHDCCYIRRELFDENHYGLYDETLKIVSDWKWFLQAIGLGHVHPVYVDVDVTLFDTTGISECNLELRNRERRQVLEEMMAPAVLADYDKHAFDMQQMDKLRQHHWAYKFVWTIERVLNRWDNKNFKSPKNK